MSDLYDKYPIPDSFPEIIHDLTREMVMRQPKDIYDFAYEYFKSKENNTIFNYPYGSWQIVQNQNNIIRNKFGSEKLLNKIDEDDKIKLNEEKKEDINLNNVEEQNNNDNLLNYENKNKELNNLEIKNEEINDLEMKNKEVNLEMENEEIINKDSENNNKNKKNKKKKEIKNIVYK